MSGYKCVEVNVCSDCYRPSTTDFAGEWCEHVGWRKEEEGDHKLSQFTETK